MINKELLKQMIDQKYVTVQKHPDVDLYIYNYSPSAQYEKIWNEVTLMCRGLILDGDENIHSRPFKKFFNYEELIPEQIPNEPFEVFTKEDGSLGISHWIGNKPYIATRGSFTSDQAIHATKILYEKYVHTFDKLNRNYTYLWEIIYPENRIVISYGDMDDLILLAVIDNATGKDIEIPEIGFQIVKRHDGINDLSVLKSLEEDNKEGFVIKFKSGYRLKIKHQEYVRLHKIITGVSNVAVWEYLSEGKPMDELLDRVPDEFYAWLKKTQSEILNHYQEIETESKRVFKTFETRKEAALYFQTQKYPSVLFQMLDGKNYSKVIWKMVRPKWSKPFKKDVEG